MIKQRLIVIHRPKNFGEIVGQAVALKFILAAIRKNMLPNGLCFVGDPGVGKTSTAICIAKAVNCENYDREHFLLCGRCSSCKDPLPGHTFKVFDCTKGLSQHFKQIENDNERLGTWRTKNNVYFFDEIHTVDRKEQERLNLLLDHCPPNVLVMCATYDEDQLARALRDRFHIIKMANPSVLEVVPLLSRICKKERVDIEKTILRELAREHIGNPRAAINALEGELIEMSSIEADSGC